MSTETIFATANSGYIESKSAVYATARAGGGSFGNAAAASYSQLGQFTDGGSVYSCNIVLLEFDLTAYAPGAAITVPVLSTWSEWDGSIAAEPTINAYVYDYGASITSADWSTSGPGTTILATLPSSNWASGAYRD